MKCAVLYSLTVISIVFRTQNNRNVIGREHSMQECYVELENPSVSNESLNVDILERFELFNKSFILTQIIIELFYNESQDFHNLIVMKQHWFQFSTGWKE